MIRKLIISLLFSVLILPMANAKSVGKVTMLKGSALVKKAALKLGDQVSEGDVVSTADKSVLKVTMVDSTVISLGPNSKMTIKNYSSLKEKRNNVINFLKGQARVLVKKKASKGESIKFNSNEIAMGVRGTEFLTNAYQSAGKANSDLLLVEGKMNVAGKGVKAFNLKPGQYFNSSDLMANGMKAIKSLSPEALKALKSGDFLPNLMDGGKLIDLQKNLLTAAGLGGAALGAASMVGGLLPDGGSSDKNSAAAGKKEMKKEKKKMKKSIKEKSSNVKGVLTYKYDLSKEKSDIRDTVLGRKKNKKKNKCFYFMYKKLPGSGEPERFRRKRSCDDFEFDL